MFEKEENGKSEDGFYRHENGTVVELVNDPDLGTPLTNAYIRAGFTYVGKTDPRLADPEKEDKVVSKK